MKKLIAFVLLILCLAVFTGGCGIQDVNQDSSIYWLAEESGFVDYVISDDCVRFQYRICFVNETPKDISVKLSAAFPKEELDGWIEYTDFFYGLNGQGEWDYQTVNASGKTQLVYTFEGKYLGGEVNTALSFPQELMIATAEAVEENSNRTLSFTDSTIQLNNDETYEHFQHESHSNMDIGGLLVEAACVRGETL